MEMTKETAAPEAGAGSGSSINAGISMSAFDIEFKALCLRLTQMGKERERMPVEHISVKCRAECPFPDGGTEDTCRGCESGIRERYVMGEAVRRVYHTAACFTDTRYRRLLKKSGLCGIQLNHTFESCVTDRLNRRVYNMLREWDYRKGCGIYIHPPPKTGEQKDGRKINPYFNVNPQGNGTGKTFALAALTHRLCAEGTACLFSTTQHFMDELRYTFDDDAKENERQVLDKYINAPVLMWDDLGKESFNRQNDWAPAKLNYVIDERIKREKPIVISSNFDVEELIFRFGSGNYGASIASRLAGHCVFCMLGGEDRRRKR